MDLEPQELFPAMPPNVACAPVDTSTGNQSPWGLSRSFRWSSTTPGSTVAVRAATFSSSTLQKYLELSMTRAAPVVWPHWLVPAPRARRFEVLPSYPLLAQSECTFMGVSTQYRRRLARML